MVPWTRQAGRKASGRELSDGFQNIHRGGRRSPSFCSRACRERPPPLPEGTQSSSAAPRPHAAANTKARVAKPKDVPCSSSEKMLWTQRRTQAGERGQEAEKRGSRGSIRAGGGGGQCISHLRDLPCPLSTHQAQYRRAGGTQRLPAKQPSPWFCRRLEPFPFRVGFWTSRGGRRLEPVASGGGGCRAGGRRAGPRGSRAARPAVDAEKGWVDTGGRFWGGGGLTARRR